MGELFLILISTGLANNFVLTHMLGVDPLIATSRKSGPAMDTCLFMVTTMPVVAAVLYLFNVYLFTPFIPDHLHLIVTVIMIAITVMLNGFILQKLHAKLFSRIEKIIPLMLANSALLGLVLIENNYVYSFLAALFFGLGSALGFSLVLIMMVSIRKKLDNPDIPVPFQGIAILFITLGLFSMGFMGFSGLNLVK